MPSMKLGLACAAIVVCSSIAHAQMDVRSLLTKIGFADDDPPSVQEPAAELPSGSGDLLIPDVDEALDTAEPLEAAEALETPALTLPQPPGELPAPAEQSLLPPAEENSVLAEQLPLGVSDAGAEPLESLRELPMLEAPTPAPLNDVPWLEDSPQAAAEPLEQINLNALQASPLQGVPGAASHAVAGTNDCGCAHTGQCSNASRCGCRAPRVAGAPCLPAPNLPPPVSAVDYYKTPLHYNNLWGGYREEQARVRAHQVRHLQGDCDCNEKSQCNQPMGCSNVTSGYCLPR